MSENEHGEVVKTGYLTKSPPLSRAPVSQWHKRWFVLMDSKLVFPMAESYVRLNYYQSETDAKSLADPKGLIAEVNVGFYWRGTRARWKYREGLQCEGIINLGTCVCVVPHTDPVKNYKHVFDVCTADRVYHLSAESTEEKLAWVNTLKELIFPPKTNKVPKDSRFMNSEGSTDVVKRSQEGSKPVRPHSFNPSSSSGGASRISSRPLPPVPGLMSPASPVPAAHKHRPLPSPPTAGLSSSNPAIHIQPVGPQISPVASRRAKGLPPLRPSPYRKNVSEPFPPHGVADPAPPSRSISSSPPHLLPEDYQEFVARPLSSSTSSTVESLIGQHDLGMPNLLPDNLEDNYSLASSVPRRQRSPAGPRPPPSPKPSAPQRPTKPPPQRPTKPPKPSVHAKPSNLAPSKLGKPAAAAPPPIASRTTRPVPRARTYKPSRPQGNIVARPEHNNGAHPESNGINSGHDYCVLEEGGPDYSVLEEREQVYSVLEDGEQDYSVLEDGEQDYSVLDNEEQNYSCIEDAGQDFCNIEDTGQDYGNIEDAGQDYSNIEDAGQDYGNIEDAGQDYGNIEDTGQDYGNIEDTGRDYENIEDAGQDYGNMEDTGQDYSVLQSTAIPGYNPRDQDYSHLALSYGTDESPPPPMRHSSLAPHHTSSHTSPPTIPQNYLCSSDLGISRTTGQAKAGTRQQPCPQRKPRPQQKTRPQQKPRPVKDGPDYANWPSSSDADDYSHLNH